MLALSSCSETSIGSTRFCGFDISSFTFVGPGQLNKFTSDFKVQRICRGLRTSDPVEFLSKEIVTIWRVATQGPLFEASLPASWARTGPFCTIASEISSGWSWHFLGSTLATLGLFVNIPRNKPGKGTLAKAQPHCPHGKVRPCALVSGAPRNPRAHLLQRHLRGRHGAVQQRVRAPIRRVRH